MKDHRFGKYICAGVTALSVIAISVLLVFVFIERTMIMDTIDKILSILSPIIFGAVLAFLFAPTFNVCRKWTEEKVMEKLKNEKAAQWAGKTVGTAASLAFLLVIVVSLCYMLLPQLYSSIRGIINMMPTYVQNIYEWLTEVFENNPDLEATVLTVYKKIVDWGVNWSNENLIPNLQNLDSLQGLEKIVGGVSSGLIGLVNLVKNVFIGLIVMIYLLNIKDRLAAQCKKIAYAFLPVKIANATVEEFRYIHKVFSGFISGKLLDSLIIGILCFILMKIMKLPFELLISVIVGVTNVIPFFGPFIGAIPSAVLVFLISPKQCLYFVLLILVLQQLDGNILGPRILGNSTGLSSFWVLFSILLFGGLFGFGGMILAVPMTAVIFDLFSKLQNYFLRRKKLETKTENYYELKKIDENNGTYINKN